MRGVLNTTIQSLFSEIVVSQEGWPLVRVINREITVVVFSIN